MRPRSRFKSSLSRRQNHAVVGFAHTHVMTQKRRVFGLPHNAVRGHRRMISKSSILTAAVGFISYFGPPYKVDRYTAQAIQIEHLVPRLQCMSPMIISFKVMQGMSVAWSVLMLYSLQDIRSNPNTVSHFQSVIFWVCTMSRLGFGR